jgi:hypothetical protein
VLPNVQTDILLTVFPNPYFLADPITTCVLIEANEIRQNANNLIRSGHHQLIIKSNRRRKQRFHYRSRKEELLCSFAMVCCWPGCRGACGLRWEKENQAQRFGKMSILLKDVSIDSQLSELFVTGKLFCNARICLIFKVTKTQLQLWDLKKVYVWACVSSSKSTIKQRTIQKLIYLVL